MPRDAPPRRRPALPVDPQPTLRRRTMRWSYGFAVFASIALIGLFARVVQLRYADPAPLLALAGSRATTLQLHGRRGALVDREGRTLAVTRMGFRLFVDPMLVGDDPWFAAKLARLIDLGPVDIDKRLTRRAGSRYEVLDPLLTDPQVRAIRKFDHPALGLEPVPVRHYPEQRLAGQVVGFVGIDGHGLAGAEYRFNGRLAAEHGSMRYLRDARRVAVAAEAAAFEPPRHGRDVALSLDAVVQGITERALAETCVKHHARAGEAIVMDSRTGQILAMANWPFFDPADRGNEPDSWSETTGVDPARWPDPPENQDADPGEPEAPAEPGADAEPEASDWPPKLELETLRGNRCVTAPYEPGSIFKPFVHAAATEAGLVSPTEIIDTTEVGYMVTDGGRLLRDAGDRGHGELTWDQVLVKSSNIGMAIVGQRLGAERMYRAVRRFGFGARPGSGLPGEDRGLVNPLRRWNHYSVTSVPMGHEIAVTPLQMVRGFSAFANGGLMVSPGILAEHAETPVVKRAIAEPVADHTRRVLRRVVTDGTGRRAQSDKYRIWGKTGTAQIPDRDRGGYIEDAHTGSFVCGAPLRNPRLIVLVVVHHPRRELGYYGGVVAAPFAKQIVEQTLEYLGEPYDAQRDRTPLDAPLARQDAP